jgi:hypothetical protein
MSKNKNGNDLYLIGDEFGNVKIGSANSVSKRLRELQTGNPNRLKVIAEFKDEGRQETFMHKLRKESRIRKDGEWFKLSERSLGLLIKFLLKRSNVGKVKIDKDYNNS